MLIIKNRNSILRSTAIEQNPSSLTERLLLAIVPLLIVPHLIVLGLSQSQTASAQLAENLYVGNTKAWALANAVTADPPGLDSVHFNPAGLTKGTKNGLFFEGHLIGSSTKSAFKIKSTPVETNLGEYYLNDCDSECLLYSFEQETADTDENSDRKSRQGIYLPGFGPLYSNSVANLDFTLLPRIAIGYKAPRSKWSFGTSSYINFTLAFKEEGVDERSLSPTIRELALGSVSVAVPTVAYKINDHWSVGAGLSLQSFGFKLQMVTGLPHPLLGAFSKALTYSCDIGRLGPSFCEDLGSKPFNPLQPLATIDFEVEDLLTLSYNAGVLWEPTQWFSWGLLYRGPAKHNLKGDMTMAYSQAATAFLNMPIYQLIGGSAAGLNGGRSENLEVSIAVTQPQYIATGLSLLVTPKLKINIDYKKSYYGRWSHWTLKYNDPSVMSPLMELASLANASLDNTTLGIEDLGISATSINIPIGMEDTQNWAFGLEYGWSSKLKLRAGYEKRPSVYGNRLPNIPISSLEMVLRNVGIVFQWDNRTVVELAAGLVKSDTQVGYDAGNILFSTPLNSEVTIDYPVLMLSWKRQSL